MTAARAAFVDALSMTSIIGAGFAVAGALVALVWLPSRAMGAEVVSDAGEPAAGSLAGAALERSAG
jgi:hypothetical protein